jgi:hypothetical protein
MRLRESIRRIVKAAWSQTSVIIIEDLHWLDEASQVLSGNLDGGRGKHQRLDGADLPARLVAAFAVRLVS